MSVNIIRSITGILIVMLIACLYSCATAAGVIAVSAGSTHTILLKSDGTVWTCGENQNGQLGDGTTRNRSAPIRVPNLEGIVDIAAGSYYCMALKSDGTVWCWGQNSFGQLGDGSSSNKLSPVQVNGLTDVIAIAAGGNHSLAVKSDGYRLGLGIQRLRPTW